MLWGRVPPYDMKPMASATPVVSKEFLRAVCEPYFEQMLEAVQHALLLQFQHASQEQAQYAMHISQSAASLSTSGHLGDCKSAELLPSPMGQQSTHREEPSTADGSEFSELGAFSAGAFSGEIPTFSAGAFSALCSAATEEEHAKSFCTSSGLREPQIIERNLICTESEMGLVSDQESHDMVCRHWKSKGWCRLEDKCKFSHPAHKRGIRSINGASGEANADMGGLLCFGNDASVPWEPNTGQGLTLTQMSLSASDYKKKPGKKRKSKGKTGGINEDTLLKPVVPMQLSEGRAALC